MELTETVVIDSDILIDHLREKKDVKGSGLAITGLAITHSSLFRCDLV